jgi:hypothetical protein
MTATQQQVEELTGTTMALRLIGDRLSTPSDHVDRFDDDTIHIVDRMIRNHDHTHALEIVRGIISKTDDITMRVFHDETDAHRATVDSVLTELASIMLADQR